MGTLVEWMHEGGPAMWGLLLLLLLAPSTAACGALLAGARRWSPALLWWAVPALLVAVGVAGRWAGQATVASVLPVVDPTQRSRILHAGLHEAVVPEMAGLALAALVLAGSAPLLGLGLALSARGGRGRWMPAGILLLAGLGGAVAIGLAEAALAGGGVGIGAFVQPVVLACGGLALGLAVVGDRGDPAEGERLAAGRVLVASLAVGAAVAAWGARVDLGFKELHQAFAYAEPGMRLDLGSLADRTALGATLPAAGALALALCLGAAAVLPVLGALRSVRTWASAAPAAGLVLLGAAAVAAVHSQAASLVGRTSEALLQRALAEVTGLPRVEGAGSPPGGCSAVAAWDGGGWVLSGSTSGLPLRSARDERVAVVAPASLRLDALTATTWVEEAGEAVHLKVITGAGAGSVAVDLVPAAELRAGGLVDPAMAWIVSGTPDGFGLHQGGGRFHRVEDLATALAKARASTGGDSWPLLLFPNPAWKIQDLVDACQALAEVQPSGEGFAAPPACTVTGFVPQVLQGASSPPAPEPGLGSLDAGQGGSGAFVEAGQDALVLGSLDQSVVQAVIRRHLNEIQYCYERGLTVQPALNGKVTIKFVIAKDGSVSSATVKSSTLRDPEVEGCIVGRFQRMRFPAPKGGGIVIVSYPFVFAAG